MSNVKTKTITSVRDGIYQEARSPGVTAITSRGKFTGVLITAGDIPNAVAARLHELIQHNPEHAINVLTGQAIS